MKYYKVWVFRLFIYVLTLNIVCFLLTIAYVEPFHNGAQYALNMLILGTLSTLCLLAGMVMVILCIKNKAVDDIKTWIATIGLTLFLIASILIPFIENQ
ncbi:hypothetical protein [Carboxylicivirga sp. RSCT41]|uniref:hypothetical protein n=1 Tax=Carboxylicivirga agarovorans TaxID=3417570 RepID=UPI003D32784D